MPDESLCDCPMEGETPADVERCFEETSVSGGGRAICSRPKEHDGPHAACNVSEHPMHVWEGDSEK